MPRTRKSDEVQISRGDGWIVFASAVTVVGMPFVLLSPQSEDEVLIPMLFGVGGSLLFLLLILFTAIEVSDRRKARQRAIARCEYVTQPSLGELISLRWRGMSGDARTLCVVFAAFVAIIVGDHFAGHRIQVSDFSDGRVEIFSWKYWGLSKKWQHIDFDHSDKLWAFAGTRRRVFSD